MPERLAPLHDRASEGGQPLVIPPTSSVGREADLVRAEVREAEVAHAPAREGVELAEVPLDRMGPLDAHQRARDVVLLAVDQLRRRPHLPEPPSAAHDRLVERVDLLVDRACEAARPAEEGERDEAEELRSHPALRMRGTSTWPPMAARGRGGACRARRSYESQRDHISVSAWRSIAG